MAGVAVFTIFGHRLLRRTHDLSGSSPLACLLPRVRGMRNTGVWPPLTSNYTGSARCSRVAEARRGVHHLPPPYTPVEHTDRAGLKLRRWSIFALALLLAAITVAVFLVMAEAKP